MSARIGSVVCGLVLVTVALVTDAEDSIVLIAGVGIRGGEQIGDYRGVANTWNRIRVQNRLDENLAYRTNAERRIIAIRCKRNDCVSERGVRMGMDDNDLRRRYGTPRKDSPTKLGVYYEYPGIGFEMVNKRVVSIYIYPHAAR